MSELLANSSDANSSEARFEIIKNDTIKLIDDGDGQDIQDIDRMYEMNRSIDISNHVDWNNKTTIKLLQGIGSYSTSDDFLQVSLGNQKFQSKTRAYFNISKNDYTFVNTAVAAIDPENGGITHPVETNKNADFSRSGFLQEFYWKQNNKNVMAARWWWQTAKRSIPKGTSYEGPVGPGLNNQSDDDNKIVIDWKHYENKYHLLLRSGYSGKQLDYTLKNFVPGVGEIPAIYSESSQKSYLNTASLKYDFTSDFAIETSINYNYHQVVSHDSVLKTGFEKDRAEISCLLALHLSFAHRLNLNLMLRQEWVDFETVPVIPYFGFDYRLVDKSDFFVKGNIARNFHRPTLNDLYWQPGGKPDLLPEEGISGELGAEYRVDYKKHELKCELTAFYSDVNNWIIWLPNYKGYWEPQNIRHVVAKGLEINLNLKGKTGKINYLLSANYAFTKSINYGNPQVWGDESYGKQLAYIPVHSGNMMVNLSWKKYHCSWQHSSYSERFTTSSNDMAQRSRFYPYFMNDIIFGKSFTLNKLTISTELKIYNLFDETYRSVLYQPMPGRNYIFIVMIKY